MKSILVKDRNLRDKGGHSIKNINKKNRQIEIQNEKILNKIKELKSNIDFDKKEKEYKETNRLR